MRFFNNVDPIIKNAIKDTALAALPTVGLVTHAATYSTLLSFITGCTLKYEAPLLRAGTQAIWLNAALYGANNLTHENYKKGLMCFGLAALNIILIKTIQDMGTFDCLLEGSESLADESLGDASSTYPL